MARKPSERGHRGKEKAHPLNIIPMMNLMIILIPVLLLTASFVQLSLINVDVPKITCPTCREQGEDVQPPLNLSIAVHEQGFTIGTAVRLLPGPEGPGGPTVPKTAEGEYDYATLTRILVEIKNEFPHESTVLISVAEEIPYQTVIHVMDASREKDGRILFAKPVLSVLS